MTILLSKLFVVRRQIFICLFTLILSFLPFAVSAQWTGAGTEQDPFKIYSVTDLEAMAPNETAFNYYENIHFELMNDINDSLRISLCNDFGGYLHGKGHSIILGMNNISVNDNSIISGNLYGTIDSLVINGKVNNFYSLFDSINQNGKLLDIVCNIVINNMYMSRCRIFASLNEGIIKNCINNSDIQNENTTIISFFVDINRGQLINCVNNGNATITTNTQSSILFFGFCNNNTGNIINCINNGDLNILGIPILSMVSVFSFTNNGILQNCINTGNINAKNNTVAGGIVTTNNGNVKNCINIGSLTGYGFAGGIVGNNNTNNSTIENCLNTGYISGNYQTGSIVGQFLLNNEQQTIKHNLNISKTNGYGLFGDNNALNVYQNPLLMLENNFYDKQMVPQAATIIGDIPENNAAKGLLTTEITGFALQSVLGNGWSYAEGRYPIPLGLENNPAALLAATPVYLHADNSENYNTIDSVSQNFTVSLENNVQWQVLYDNVLLQEENAIIQNFGNELLTGSLDNYSKKIPIIIKPIQSSIPTTEFNEIFIYPNPVQNELKIESELKINSVEICDLTSKIIVANHKLQFANSILINLSSLPQGIYFVKIYTDKGVKIEKIIKN